MPPQLDDLGTKQVISGTPASDDLLPFYDISEFGNDKLKKTTVAALLGGAAGSTDTITTSDGTAAAAAGDLGEIISQAVGANSLADGVAETLDTIELSPGEWDLQASVSWASTLATTIDRNVTIADPELSAVTVLAQTWSATTASLSVTDVTRLCRVRVTSTTSYTLRATASFSSGAVSVIQSILEARRVR